MSKTAEYPSEVPSEAILNVVRIGKGGPSQIVAERQLFAQSFWIAQGYVQRLAIGVPISIAGSDGTEEAPPQLAKDTFVDAKENIRDSLKDHEAFDALEAMAEPDTAIAQDLPIPASLILGWLLNKFLAWVLDQAK